MSIPHRPYRHIVNSNVDSFVRKFSTEENMHVEEKIDGSNFYFASNGTNAVCGRRHAILDDAEIFYNFQKILHLKDNIMQLYHKLIKKDSVDEFQIVLYLYGELIPIPSKLNHKQ